MEAMDQQIHDPLIKVKGTPISGQPIKGMVLSFCICVMLCR